MQTLSWRKSYKQPVPDIRNADQKGLTLLGKTTFDRHIKVDVATAEHLVEKKRARGKTTTRYPDDPEMRDVYEEELRRLRLRAVLLDEAQHLITSGDGKQPKDQLNWIKSMEIGKSTRLNSSHQIISYAVFCLKKKNI